MLPSTRRPKEVEEERALRLEQDRQEQLKKLPALKLKISKDEIFMRTMKEWYLTMREKDKKRLTPKQLKRKAVNVCFKEKIVYDDLPLEWVDVLRNDCNLKLYQKKKDAKARKNSAKSGKKVEEPTRNNAHPKRKFPTKKGEGIPIVLEVTWDELSAQNNEKSATEPKKTCKEFVDLTGDPPPPAWLESYAKGIVLPRVLILYAMCDKSILFYDYSPKLEDAQGNEVKLEPRPRPGFWRPFGTD